jgi:hypothetical protein
MTTPTAPVPFRLSNEGLTGHVEVDGHDISHLTTSATLRMDAGALPHLDVTLNALLTDIECVGTVTVTRPEPPVNDDRYLAANLFDLAQDLRAYAASEDFAVEVSMRLASIGDDPTLAAAEVLASYVQAASARVGAQAALAEFAP